MGLDYHRICGASGKGHCITNGWDKNGESIGDKYQKEGDNDILLRLHAFTLEEDLLNCLFSREVEQRHSRINRDEGSELTYDDCDVHMIVSKQDVLLHELLWLVVESEVTENTN